LAIKDLLKVIEFSNLSVCGCNKQFYKFQAIVL